MAYTALDRFAAWWRFRAAFPHIHPHARVCDIGCGPSARFLQSARSRISFGVGFDYQELQPAPDGAALVRADLTESIPLRSSQFDHATMLAVLEHLTHPEPLFVEVYRILVPGGSLIMTWPQAAVDMILSVTFGVGLSGKEMEPQKHQPRIPLPKLSSMLGDVGFTGCQHRRFELGLNNLLVCYKPR